MNVTVISLARRPERLAGFWDRWAELGLDWPVDVLEATDGENISTQVAEAACTQSHYRALLGAVQPLLVLEDDVCWAPGAGQVLADLQLPERWDQLYLGGHIFSHPRPVSPGLVEVDAMSHTHAYMIRSPRQGVSDLRSHLGGNIEKAYNTFTHWRRLALRPFIAGQVAGPSDIVGDRTVPFWRNDA